MKLNVFKFFNTFKFEELLLIFFPLLIISGPFFSDLSVVFFSIFCLFYIIKKKIKNLVLFNYKFIFIFWFFCFFSTIINYSFDSISLKLTLKSIALLRFYLFICFIIFLIECNKSILKHIFNIVFFILIFLSVDSYLQLIFKFNLFGYEKIDPKRLSGIFNDEYILGSILFKISILMLYTSKFSKINENYILLFFLIIIEPLIFFSGQRGPFLISVILIMGMFFINYKNKYFYISLIYLILLIGGNLIFNKKYNERFIFDIKENLKYDNVIDLKNNEQKKLNYSILTPSHTQLYASSLQMFYEKKLFGHGTNSFRHKCKDYNKCSTHPHNFYLQMLAEGGLTCFLFLFGFFCYILIDYLKCLNSILIRKKKNLSASYYLILGILLIFFPLQPNGNFFNNYMLVQISFLVAIYLHERKETTS